MSDTAAAPAAPATDAEDARSRLELLAAILLGLAALVAAWAAYQSGKASGDATDAASAASASLVDSNFFFGQGNQQVATDTQLFITYVEALQAGDTDLADYVFSTLMSPNLQEAVTFVEDPTSDAVTPFDDVEGNPYTVEDYDSGQQLLDDSDALYAAVEDANEKGDQYDLAGVLLAVALFIGGIGTLFKKPILSYWLLALGAVALVAGATVTFAA